MTCLTSASGPSSSPSARSSSNAEMPARGASVTADSRPASSASWALTDEFVTESNNARRRFTTIDGPLWAFGRIESPWRRDEAPKHYEHYRVDVRLQPARRIGVRWGLGVVAASRSEWRGANVFRGVNYDWSGDRLELLIGTRVLRVRRCWATVTER